MDETGRRLPWNHISYRRMYIVATVCGFLISGISSGIYHWYAFYSGQGKFGRDEVAYLFLIPAFTLVACIFFRDRIQNSTLHPLALLCVRITLTIELWAVGGTILIFSPFMLVHLALNAPGEIPEAIGYMVLMLFMYSVMALMAFPLLWAISVGTIWIVRLLSFPQARSES